MDRFIGLAPVIVFLIFLLYVSYRGTKSFRGSSVP